MGTTTYTVNYAKDENAPAGSISLEWNTEANGDVSPPFALGGGNVFFNVLYDGDRPDYDVWVTAGSVQLVSAGNISGSSGEVTFIHENEKSLGQVPVGEVELAWIRNPVIPASVESVNGQKLTMSGNAVGLASIGTLSRYDLWRHTLPTSGYEKVAILARAYTIDSSEPLPILSAGAPEDTGARTTVSLRKIYGASASLIYDVRDSETPDPGFRDVDILCVTTFGPLNGANLIMTLERGGLLAATTNFDGWAFFENVPYGTHGLKTSHPRITDSMDDALANDFITVGPEGTVETEYESDDPAGI